MSIVQAIEKHLPGYPKGDPGEIRQAANIFQNVSSQLGSLCDTANTRVTALTSDWSDSVKTSFQDEWGQFYKQASTAATEIGNLATQLKGFADELDGARRKYDVALAATCVTGVVAVGLSVVTIGVSDEVEGGVVVAEATAAVTTATSLVEAISSAIDAVVTTIAGLLPRLAVLFGVNVAAQSAAGAIIYPDHNPIKHVNLEEAGLTAGSFVAFEALAGLFGGVGVEGTALNQVAKIGGAGLSGAGVDAGLQEITTGHINPGEVAWAGLGGAGIEGLSIAGAAGFARLSTIGDLPQELTPTEKLLYDSPILRDRVYVPLQRTADNIPEGVWADDPKARGWVLEHITRLDLETQNPGSGIITRPRWPVNFEKIDSFGEDSGHAISFKTLDSNAPTYQSRNALFNKLNHYASELDLFDGGRKGDVIITERMIASKELLVGLPSSGLRSEQLVQLKELVNRWVNLDITIPFDIKFVVL